MRQSGKYPALHLALPERSGKPRRTGISNMVDNGYGLAELRDKLELCHPYVDIVKLGWASAYITTTLGEKVALFRKHDIRTCPGGMMFELCYWQGKIEAYADFLRTHGIDMVEVSNGSLPIPEAEKRRMIEWFAKAGFTVLAEVGSKDVNAVSPPEVWTECLRADLEHGAWKVITEGRADASAGIYTSDGNLRTDIMDAILASDVDNDLLVFEAPHKRQMTWFIKTLGANVNLGNVPLGEFLNLETLRLGLRGDTVGHFHGKMHETA